MMVRSALVVVCLLVLSGSGTSQAPSWKKSAAVSGKARVESRHPQIATTPGKAACAALHKEFTRLSQTFRREYAKGNGTENPSSMDLDAEVAFSGPKLCSLSASIWTYTGGAHPSVGYDVFNFGYVNGKLSRLTLQSLFRKGISARPVVEPIVLGKLLREGAAWVEDGGLRDLGDLLKLFVIRRDGLRFIIPPYAAGPWTQGTFEIDIPFGEIRRELDPKGPLAPVLK